MSHGQITELLQRWNEGDREAVAELMPLVYDELRRVARRLQRRDPNGTLRPTALVHEAYLRLVRQDQADWRSRAHFFGAAATMMRQILVDQARRAGAAKRGGGERRVPVEIALETPAETQEEILAVDRALERFAAFDPRRARIVELRYFGGLSIEETAEVLRVSAATIKRDWAVARMWLHRAMKDVGDGGKRLGRDCGTARGGGRASGR